MKKPSDDQREKLRQSIIGLGEKSVRKSYYPELQDRIRELEQSNKDLQAQVEETLRAQAATKKLQTQLQQSQKMEAIGTLAGGIAHDFNNILTIIHGYTELAQLQINTKCAKNDCPATKDLQHVLDGAARAKDLVNQILTFSRAQDYEKKPLILGNVVTDALALVRSSLPQSVIISTHLDNTDGLILANETQVHQIIVNLCTNGSHAIGSEGGKLSIHLETLQIDPLDIKAADMQISSGQYMLLSVKDNGCGMNRNTLDRIFDPYFTTKPLEKGTGMGLSVVHGIVKNHGGHIDIYSEPGKGTSVHIYLPKISAHDQQIETITDNEIYCGTENVLLIDDEPPVAFMQQRILESLGYTVTVKTNPYDAIDVLAKDPDMYDLVITDMTMPRMNGAQLSQAMLKIKPDLPIILCTGYSELIDETKAKAIGVKEFAMKPIVRQSISTIIKNILS